VALALSGAASLVACDAIIGTKERYFADTEPDAGDASRDATTDAGAADAFSLAEASTDPLDAGADAADADADAAPIDPDLVAFWTFDEDGGVVAHDGTGHGNDLVVSNGAAIGGQGYFGTGALEFPTTSGQAASVNLSGVDGGFPPAGTLSMWCVFATPPDDVARGIFDYYDQSRHHFFVHYTGGDAQQNASYALDFAMEDGANFDFFADPRPVLATGPAWTHLVLVWDTTTGPATSQFYVDDKLPAQSDEAYAFGNGPLDQAFILYNGFTGLYDDIYLWDRPFTNVEVASLPTRAP
jgi:hypothetical protein